MNGVRIICPGQGKKERNFPSNVEKARNKVIQLSQERLPLLMMKS